jgi:flagellar biosynthesis protein FlhB
VVVALTMLPGLFEGGRDLAAELLYGVRDVAADPTPERMQQVLSGAFGDFLALVLPIMVVLCAVAVVSNLAQTGLLVSTQALKPSLKRLNPMQGFKRMFSP